MKSVQINKLIEMRYFKIIQKEIWCKKLCKFLCDKKLKSLQLF